MKTFPWNKKYSKLPSVFSSTTEIAREAGCNQALIHYYFRTKDRLFTAIFEKKIALFINTFLVTLKEDIPFEEKVRRAVETHFTVMCENPRMPFLILNELSTNPERIQALKEQVGGRPSQALSYFRTELEEEIKAGRVRQVAPLDLLLTMISLNTAPFYISPIMKVLMDLSDEEFHELIMKRKEENITVLLKSLKP